MKKSISLRRLFDLASIVASALVFTGCGREAASTSRTKFTIGAERQEITENLVQSGASVLSESDEEIVAEVGEAGMPRPMRVTLRFADGKLKEVLYSPL